MHRAASIVLVWGLVAASVAAAPLRAQSPDGVAPAAASEPVTASGPPTQIVPPGPAPTSAQPPAAASFQTFEDGDTRVSQVPNDGADTCRAAGPVKLGQDLRSVIFLDPAEAQDCFGSGRRRIETYAGFDGGTDPANADSCAAPQEICTTLAQSLRLPKQRHRTVMRSDGWIDVIVVTKGDPALAATPLRYTIMLHTTQSHLTLDLKAFTTALNAIAGP
jgi:hypothetical protein